MRGQMVLPLATTALFGLQLLIHVHAKTATLVRDELISDQQPLVHESNLAKEAEVPHHEVLPLRIARAAGGDEEEEGNKGKKEPKKKKTPTKSKTKEKNKRPVVNSKKSGKVLNVKKAKKTNKVTIDEDKKNASGRNTKQNIENRPGSDVNNNKRPASSKSNKGNAAGSPKEDKKNPGKSNKPKKNPGPSSDNTSRNGGKETDKKAPKRKSKWKCEAKQRCKDAGGKCKKKKFLKKKPEKCTNSVKNGCKRKKKCKCCLKSGTCKNKYRKQKCIDEGGKAKLRSKCKKDKNNNWVYGKECTCCLQCKTKGPCKKKGGKCGVTCPNGVISNGKCGGKGCQCCRKRRVNPTQGPPVQPTQEPPVNPTPRPPVQPTQKPPVNPTPRPPVNPTPGPPVKPTQGPSVNPTPVPPVKPTTGPGGNPITVPGGKPTTVPGGKPTTVPGGKPTTVSGGKPTTVPGGKPTTVPGGKPTTVPGGKPTTVPGGKPTTVPGGKPTTVPGGKPTTVSGGKPTTVPGGKPTTVPGGKPTTVPGGKPTTVPGGKPTTVPGGKPTTVPGGKPTTVPGGKPTTVPGGKPTTVPGGKPTTVPGGKPTTVPGGKPTTVPGGKPTTVSGGKPTTVPGGKPTTVPGGKPTTVPGGKPTTVPGGKPTTVPGPVPGSATSAPIPTSTIWKPPGGATTVPSPGGATTVPSPGGVTPAPSPGGATPATSPGPATPAPSPGGATPAPSPGGATSAPSPGGSTPAPSPGGATSVPSPGGVTPAPTPGGATPAPSPGGATSVPSPGGVTPAPTPGGATPAASTGASPSAPSLGGSTPVSSPGGSTLAPSPGGSTSAPSPGGSTFAPGESGSSTQGSSVSSGIIPSGGSALPSTSPGGSTPVPSPGGSTLVPFPGGSTLATPSPGGSTFAPSTRGTTSSPSPGGPTSAPGESESPSQSLSVSPGVTPSGEPTLTGSVPTSGSSPGVSDGGPPTDSSMGPTNSGLDTSPSESIASDTSSSGDFSTGSGVTTNAGSDSTRSGSSTPDISIARDSTTDGEASTSGSFTSDVSTVESSSAIGETSTGSGSDTTSVGGSALDSSTAGETTTGGGTSTSGSESITSVGSTSEATIIEESSAYTTSPSGGSTIVGPTSSGESSDASSTSGGSSTSGETSVSASSIGGGSVGISTPSGASASDTSAPVDSSSSTTVTSGPPTNTTAASPTSNIRTELEALRKAMEELHRGMQQNNSGRRKRLTVENDSRSKRQTTVTFIVTTFIRIRKTMFVFIKDMLSLNIDDLDDIIAMKVEVTKLKTQINSSSVDITNQDFAIVKTTMKSTRSVLKNLKSKENNEMDSIELESKSAAAKTIQKSFGAISSSFQSIQTAISSGGSESSEKVMIVITKITKLSASINNNGPSAITEKQANKIKTAEDELSTFVTQAKSIFFSAEDIKKLNEATMKVEASKTEMTRHSEEIAAQQKSKEHFSLVIKLEQVVDAVTEVSKQMKKKLAELKESGATGSGSLIAIDKAVITTMKKVAVNIESVSDTEIDDIYKFVNEVEPQLSSGFSKIEGFQEFVSTLNILRSSLEKHVDEKAAKSAMADTVDRVNEFKFYITEISEISIELQSEASGQSIINENANLVTKKITEYFGSTKFENVAEVTIAKTEELEFLWLEYLHFFENKEIDGTVAKALLVEVINAANTTKENIKKVEATLEEKKVMREEAKENEKVTLVHQQMKQTVETLITKISKTSQETLPQNIQDHMNSIIVLLKIYTSKNKELTEEQFKELQDTTEKFSKGVKEVKEISQNSKYSELLRLVKKSLDISSSKENRDKMASDIDEKLQVYYKALEVFIAIEKTLIELLLLDQSTETYEYMTVDTLKMELELVDSDSFDSEQLDVFIELSESLKDIPSDAKDLDIVKESASAKKEEFRKEIIKLEEKMIESKRVALLNDITEAISSAKTSLLNIIETIKSSGSQSDSPLKLIEFSKSLADLMEIKDIVTKVTVDEFIVKVTALSEFGDSIPSDKPKEKDIDEVLDELEFAKTILDKEIRQNEKDDSSISIQKSIKSKMMKIESMLKDLQSEKGDTAVNDELIDEIYEYVINIQDAVAFSLSDFETVESIEKDLEFLIFEMDIGTNYKGFTYNLEDILEELPMTTMHINEWIKQEEELEQSSASHNKNDEFITYLEEIAKILNKITSFSETSGGDDDVALKNAMTKLEDIQKNPASVLIEDLENILGDLKKIDKTSNMAEEALQVAEEAVKNVSMEAKKHEKKLNNRLVSMKHEETLSTLKYMQEAMKALNDALGVEKLDGEPEEDVDRLVISLEDISDGVDIDLEDLKASFNDVIDKAYESDHKGGLLTVLTLVTSVIEKVQEESEEHQTISSSEDENSILVQKISLTEDIKKAVETMVETIMGAKITSESKENVSFAIEVMKEITEVSVEELEKVYQDIKNMEAIEGQEFGGIFELEGKVEEALGSLKGEKEASDDAEEAQEKTNDLQNFYEKLSQVSQELEDLEDFFSSEKFVAEDATEIYPFKDLKDLLEGTNVDQVDYTVSMDISEITEEFFDIYDKSNVDVKEIQSLKALTKEKMQSTKKRLKELKTTSKSKASKVILQKAVSLFARIEKNLQIKIKDRGEATGTPVEIAEITTLANEFRDLKKISSKATSKIEKIFKKVENISVTSGDNINNIDRAMKDVKSAVKEVSERFELAQDSAKRESDEETYRKWMTLMEEMEETMKEKLQHNVTSGSDGDQSGNALASELITLIDKLSLEKISRTDFTEIKEKYSNLINENVSSKKWKDIRKKVGVFKEEIRKTASAMSIASKFSEDLELSENYQKQLSLLTQQLDQLINSAPDEVQTESELVNDIEMILDDNSMDDNSIQTGKKIEELKLIIIRLTLSTEVSISKLTLQNLKISVNKARNTESEKIHEYKNKIKSKMQIQTLMESKAEFESAKETISLMKNNNGDAEDNEEMYTILLKFKGSSLSLNKESLSIFKVFNSELSLGQAKGKIITKINETLAILDEVIKDTNNEISTMQEDSQREEEAALRIVATRYLEEALKVFKSVIKNPEEIDMTETHPMFELDKANEIIELIDSNTASKEELEIFKEYVLDIKENEFTSEKMKTVLQNTISNTETLVERLRSETLEYDFDAESTEKVTSQKIILAILADIMESIQRIQIKGTGIEGTGNKTSDADIVDIKKLLKLVTKTERESSNAFIRSLEKEAKKLSSQKIDVIFYEKNVKEFEKLQKEVNSAEVAVSTKVADSKVSKSQALESKLLRKVEKIYKDIEKTLKQINSKKVNPSTKEDVIKDLHDFVDIKKTSAYSKEDTFTLEGHLEDLLILKKEEKELDLGNILSQIKNEILSVAEKASESEQMQREADKSNKASAVDKVIEGSKFFTEDSDDDPSAPSDEQKEEATKLYHFVLVKDLSSMTVHETKEFAGMMESLNGTGKTIPSMSIVMKNLIQFRYKSRKSHDVKREKTIAKRASKILKESEKVLKSMETALNKIAAKTKGSEEFEIVEEVSNLYRTLSGFRESSLINERFKDALVIDLSSVKTADGKGIAYVNELLELITKFLMMSKSDSQRLDTYTARFEAENTLTFISMLTTKLESYFNGKNGDEETEASSASNQDTTTESQNTDISSEGSEEEEEDDQSCLQALKMISTIFEPNVKSELHLELRKTIDNCLKDFENQKKSIEKDSAEETILKLNKVKDAIAQSIRRMDSTVSGNQLTSTLEDSKSLTMSLMESIKRIQIKGTGTAKSQEILSSIRKFFDDRKSGIFSPEERETLGHLSSNLIDESYELGNVDVKLFPFEDIKNAVLDVKKQYDTLILSSDQSSSTSSKRKASSSSSISSTGASFSQVAEMENYIFEAEMYRVNQQNFISDQSLRLFENVIEVFSNTSTENAEVSGDDNSSHSDGTTADDIVSVGSEEDESFNEFDLAESDSKEFERFLEDFTISMKYFGDDIENTDASFLTYLSTSITNMQGFSSNSNIKINKSAITKVLKAVTIAKQKFSESAESLKGTAKAGMKVIKQEKAIKSIENVENLFKAFDKLLTTDSLITEMNSDTMNLMSSITFITQTMFGIRTGSQITVDTLIDLDDHIEYLRDWQQPEYTLEIRMMKQLLEDQKANVKQVLIDKKNGVLKGQAKTKQYQYLNNRALLLIENVTIPNIESSSTDTEESTSSNRLMKIVVGIIDILKSWTKRSINMMQVKKCEEYIDELNVLIDGLTGSKVSKVLLDKMNVLTESLAIARESGIKNREMTEKWEEKDKEYDIIYDSDQFFEYCTDFFTARYSVNSDSDSVKELPEVNSMIEIMENVSTNREGFTLASMTDNVNIYNVTLTIASVPENIPIAGIDKLRILFADMSMDTKVKKQRQFYDSINAASSEAMKVISSSVVSSESSESFESQGMLSEMMNLAFQSRHLANNIDAMNRDDMKTFSKSVQFGQSLQGVNAPYINEIMRSLSKAIYASNNKVKYSEKLYEIEQILSVLSDEENIIDAVNSRLLDLQMNSSNVSIYEAVENVTKAYDMMKSFTIGDFSKLYKMYTENIFLSLNTIELPGEHGIKNLLELQYMTDELLRLLRHSKIMSQYYLQHKLTSRLKDAMRQVITELKRFRQLNAGEEEKGNDSLSTNDGGTNDLTTATDSVSGQTETEQDDEAQEPTLAEIIAQIKNMTQSFGENASMMEIEIVQRFEDYSKSLSLVSNDNGLEMDDLEILITELSRHVRKLHVVAQSHESAILVTEESNKRGFNHRTKSIIMSSVMEMKNNGGSSETNNIMKEMEENCFPSRLSDQILDENTETCREYAYDFSSTSYDKGDTTLDVTKLKEAMENSSQSTSEYDGFIFVQEYQYKNIFETIEGEGSDEVDGSNTVDTGTSETSVSEASGNESKGKDEEKIQQKQMLSRVSETGYILHNLIYILTYTNDILGKSNTEGEVSPNNTLLQDVQTTLRALSDGSNINIGMLHHFIHLNIQLNMKMEQNIALNQTELENTIELVNKTHKQLDKRFKDIKEFAIFSTTAIVTEYAAYQLTEFADEIMEKTKMEEEAENGTTYSNSTDDNNITEVMYKLSDMTMRWKFSISDFNLISVKQFKDLMLYFKEFSMIPKSITSSLVSLLQYTLIKSNRTLIESIKDANVAIGEKKASFLESKYKISLILFEIETLAEIIENHTGTEDSEQDGGGPLAPGEETTVDCADLTTNEDGEGVDCDKDDDKNGEDENNIISNRVNKVIKESINIIEEFKNMDFSEYEIILLHNHRLEISDLLKANGNNTKGFDFGNLTETIDIAREMLNSSLEALEQYYDELHMYVSYTLEKTFFEQVLDMVNFTVNLINNQNETNGNDSSITSSTAVGTASTVSSATTITASTVSSATTTTASTVSSATTTTASTVSSATTTTASSSSPPVNTTSSSNGTDYCTRNESFLCRAQNLYDSIMEYSNKSESDTSTERTDATDSTTTVSEETTAFSDDAEEARYFMDMYNEEDRVHEVREKSYRFWQGIVGIRKKDLQEKDQIISKLERIQELIVEKISVLEGMVNSVNLTDVENIRNI